MIPLNFFDTSLVLMPFSRSARYVSLKILEGSGTDSQAELKMLDAISENTIQHPGRELIMMPLDSFYHRGPNGNHLCLVFEAMGPDAVHVTENFPPEVFSKRDRDSRALPIWMAKSVLRHGLLAIDFLHQCGIAHGDFQPGNLLLSIKDISSVEEDSLSQEHMDKRVSRPLVRLDGKEDRWAPKYLADNMPLVEFVDFSPQLVVKLSDVGGAFFFSDPPAKHSVPVGLWSPEVLCGGKVSSQQDIWSFGCLIYEFITGGALFPLFNWDADKRDDELFQLLVEVIGPMPRDLFSSYPRWNKYLDADGNIIEEPSEDNDQSETEGMGVLEAQFDKLKPEDMSDEVATTIKALLRQILQYDPAKRPSASELLKNPWFNGSS